MPYGDPIAIEKCETKGDVHRAAQERLEKFLIDLHKSERKSKTMMESVKSHVMKALMDVGDNKNSAENRELKSRRQIWLREVYVPILRTIGMSRTNIDRGLMGSNYFILDNVIYDSSAKDVPLMKIHTGREAFQQVESDNEQLARSVFVKKGGLSDSRLPKQYVEDDHGHITRRYAYVEKAWDVFALIMGSEDGLMARSVGTPEDPATARTLKGDPRLIAGSTAAKWETGKQAGERLSDSQVAFLNQEEGSTTQRGHPLSSTSKHLHGNEGYFFGKHDGVLLKVDLALIPKEGNDQLLLNLYSHEAQVTDKKHGTTSMAQYNTKYNKKDKVLTRDVNGDGPEVPKYTAQEMKEHSDVSASKNRELHLMKFPRSAIVSVFYHAEEKADEVARLIGGAPIAAELKPHPAEHENELY